MEKKVIEVPVTGITTNTEEYQDGACQQLHNLRNKHGEWRVVGNKINTSTVELGATGSTDIPDAAVVIDTLLHPALGSDYLLVHFTHEGDHYLYSIKLIDDTWERQQSLLTGASEVLTIDSFGEYLLVSTVDKGYTFKINTETKVFTELPLFPEPELCSVSNIDYYEDSECTYTASTTSDAETMLGPYFEKLGEQKLLNRYRGNIMARVVFIDQQGNHIYVSPLMYTYLGSYGVETSTVKTFTQKDIRLILSSRTITQFRFSGAILNLTYTSSAIDVLRLYAEQGIVKEVALFTSRVWHNKEYIAKNWIEVTSDNYYADLSDNYNTALEQLENNAIMYKNTSWNINDFIAMIDAETGDEFNDGSNNRIKLTDIDNITTGETLQINNTWTAIRALQSVLDYNAHAHLCGVRNQFRDVFIPLADESAIYNIISGYVNISPGYVSGVRVNTTTFNSAKTYSFFVQYSLNVRGKAIVITKEIDDFDVFETIDTDEPSPYHIDYHVYFKTGWGYPSEYIETVTIILKQDGVYYKLYATDDAGNVERKTNSIVSDEALFYDEYSFDDLTITCNFQPKKIVIPEPDADLSASGLTVFTISQTNNYYDDVNRVQVSYQDNPFVFPTKYSYRFGTILNSVVAAQTAADAMSEGQFGQFPLYVFTGSGIYSLDHGTGDILYQTITPLNREVALSKRMIIPAASTVVFATARGLLAMQGREVIELSRAMDGSSELVPASDPYMSNVLSDTTHLSEAHTFTGFDFNADIARSSARMLFDDKEDEILISVKDGSDYRMYAYNITSKMWSTRSDKFDFVYQAYPGYRAARISTIVQGEATVPVILLYNPHTELGKAYYSDVVIITRPVFTDFRMYKNIKRVAVKGKLTAANNAFITLLNHYSADEDNYRLIAARQAEGSGIRTLYLHDSHVLTKCNIYTLIGRMKVGDVVSHILIEYAKRFKTKLR